MSLKLKAKLVEKGIKQKEVSLKLGLTVPTVSLKLNGKADWKLGELQTIQALLKERGDETTIDELL